MASRKDRRNVAPGPTTRLGRYEVLARLSAGGMAELFLACLRGPGGFRKFVAIKRILADLRSEEDFVAMFLDEARITAAMSHANIAQVFELAEDGQDLYIAMEFIAGQDLQRILKTLRTSAQRAPVPFSAAVMRDALKALHYAHTFTSPGGRALPVIHRDVSPRNVMVTYGGAVKVIDFGIAKARGCISNTRAGNVKGSPAYMSPEAIKGEPMDGRADLFAASAVLYEALTGLRAFQAPDDAGMMYRVLNAQLEPPHVLNPEVPEALSMVVLKGLAKDPAERFESARAMAQAVEEAAPSLWSEEQCGRYVSELFSEARARSQALLAMADEANEVRLVEAAEALGEIGLTPSRGAPSPLTSSSNHAAPSTEEPTRRLRSDPGTPRSTEYPPAREVVLAVDDSKVGRMLVERLLSSAGYEVLSAASGSEALEVLSQLRPDLIILDVMMPEMNGFELSQRIREISDFRKTPIFFLSAACSLEERVRGLSVGGDEFIRKPFDGSDLLARVRGHLQRVRALKSAAAVE